MSVQLFASKSKTRFNCIEKHVECNHLLFAKLATSSGVLIGAIGRLRVQFFIDRLPPRRLRGALLRCTDCFLDSGEHDVSLLS